MKTSYLALTFILILSLFLHPDIGYSSAHEHEVGEKSRCPVCGMFVAKYKPWWAQLTVSDGVVHTFDGVKDMMAYYFSPETYGGSKGTSMVKVAVKDYYTQEWFDGEKAFYVIGSDILGPMGHELIPFNSKAAAESFLKDHKGKEIITFSEISAQQITSMKKGHKMKHNKMKEKK